MDSMVAIRVPGQHGQVTVHSRGVVEQSPHNQMGLGFDDVVDQLTIQVQRARSGVVDVNDGDVGVAR
jgi:hypothetical protein